MFVDGVTYDYAYYVTHSYPFMPLCGWGTPGEDFSQGPGGEMGPQGEGTGGPQSCAQDPDCGCVEFELGCACSASPLATTTTTARKGQTGRA